MLENKRAIQTFHAQEVAAVEIFFKLVLEEKISQQHCIAEALQSRIHEARVPQIV